jgi:hypothetical protein
MTSCLAYPHSTTCPVGASVMKFAWKMRPHLIRPLLASADLDRLPADIRRMARNSHPPRKLHKPFEYVFGKHRLDLDTPAPQVSGHRAARAPTGRVSHGILAVHTTGRSAYRHQHGKDRYRRTAARWTRHAHHLHQRWPSGCEGTRRRCAAAVEQQRVGCSVRASNRHRS